MRWLVMAVCFVSAALAPTATVQAQVEVDRIVSRVDGRVITSSDIRQARALRLVDDSSSDDAVQRALENRSLILNELSRAAPLAPTTDDDVNARRGEWLASLGGDPGPLLQQTGMSQADLDAWIRDDVRIRAYLRRQFGMLNDGERSRAAADWVARLRQRAGLAR